MSDFWLCWTATGLDIGDVLMKFCKTDIQIPPRQVRRMGSEFLGKRSADLGLMQKIEEVCKADPVTCHCIRQTLINLSGLMATPGKRGLGAILLSGNRMSNRYLPIGFKRRAMGSEFLGKRALGSEFLGKRRPLGSEFLGKRSDPDMLAINEEDLSQAEQVWVSELTRSTWITKQLSNWVRNFYRSESFMKRRTRSLPSRSS